MGSPVARARGIWHCACSYGCRHDAMRRCADAPTGRSAPAAAPRQPRHWRLPHASRFLFREEGSLAHRRGQQDPRAALQSHACTVRHDADRVGPCASGRRAGKDSRASRGLGDHRQSHARGARGARLHRAPRVGARRATAHRHAHRAREDARDRRHGRSRRTRNRGAHGETRRRLRREGRRSTATRPPPRPRIHAT